MNDILKSRPQIAPELIWSESRHLVEVVWKLTLAYHTTDSATIKLNIFNCLNNMQENMCKLHEQLFEYKKQFSHCLYKNCPQVYENEWYEFVSDIVELTNQFQMSMLRMFMFKDILIQIDNNNPQKGEIEQALNTNKLQLHKLKLILDQIVKNTSQATHDSIVAAIAIERSITIEEAERIQRARWE